MASIANAFDSRFLRPVAPFATVPASFLHCAVPPLTSPPGSFCPHTILPALSAIRRPRAPKLSRKFIISRQLRPPTHRIHPCPKLPYPFPEGGRWDARLGGGKSGSLARVRFSAGDTFCRDQLSCRSRRWGGVRVRLEEPRRWSGSGNKSVSLLGMFSWGL